MRTRSRKPGGFTLIEILVVILIISILVALVASFTGVMISYSKAKGTQADLQVLLAAIRAFRDANDNYPNATDIAMLRTQLEATPQARERLANLSEQAYPPDPGKDFLDQFGRALRYDMDGGKGGEPVLISAGPNGMFGTIDEKPSSGDWVKLQAEWESDNVRSDGEL